MRKVITALLVLIVLIALMGCGEKAKKGDVKKTDSFSYQIRMDPLPFKNVTASLKPVAKELSLYTPAEAYRVGENVYEQSFAIGVISANAVMAISSREESKLKAYTETLIEYSKNIGLKDEILKMADEIQSVLSTGSANKWERLEKLIIQYQTEVELAFYQEGMLDQYTLMQLGGWAEGLNSISALYADHWDEKGAKTINQRGIVNALLNNLELIQSEKIKSEKYYDLATIGFKRIKEIIYSVDADEFYTREDLQEVNKISHEIVESVRNK